MTASSTQTWDPARYAAHARFVSDFGISVVEWLALRLGERILDLGCGDGALTRKLVELGCEAIGVDASPDMVAATRALGLDARVMDGHALQFDEEFDAVFSNAALHWMKEPESVIDGVWRALKPGGRFVAEMGGHGNCAAIIAALDSALAARGLAIVRPWFFPSEEEYQALLEKRGFSVERIVLFPRPTPLPGDVSGWLETFAQPYIAALPASDRKRFGSEIVEALRPVFCDAHGHWTADYVRLRFSATKPK